ncbi:MAG: hypothetical protein AAFQ71_11590 [Planctomycetota bacterium]
MATRRGAAMLLVLVALIVGVTAAATIARVSATRVLGRADHDRVEGAGGLLRAVKPAVAAWLEEESGRAIDDPSGDGIAVLDDRIALDGSVVEIRVSVFDRRAAVPKEMVARPEIAAALPPEILLALEPDRSAAAWLGPIAEFPGCVAGEPPSVYSRSVQTASTSDSSHDNRELALRRFVSLTEPQVESEAIDGNSAPVVLNLNPRTVPIALLEGLLPPSEREIAADIDASRREVGPDDESPVVPTATVPLSSDLTLRLESGSDRWAFRIDLAIDGVRRSWWEVHQRTEAGWRLEVREAIDG